MAKKEITIVKEEIRKFNKLVQEIIKERILKNRETRSMKIKFKDEQKNPYSIEQLKQLMNQNKYYLVYEKNKDNFVQIIRDEEAKLNLLKENKKLLKQERQRILTQEKVDDIEIQPKQHMKQLLNKQRIKALYRKYKYPNQKWQINGNYEGFEDFYEKHNQKVNDIIRKLQYNQDFKKLGIAEKQQYEIQKIGQYIDQIESELKQ